MKGLPAALRSRKRYIAFRIIAKEKVDESTLSKALTEKMLSIFGESDMCDVKVEWFDGEIGIISCSLECLEKTIISFTLITNIKDVNVVPLTLATSGTIKGCMKKMGVVK